MPTYEYRCKSCDHEFEVVNLVQDPEVALAHAVEISASKLLTSRRSWIVDQRFDPVDYPLPILFRGDCQEILLYR